MLASTEVLKPGALVRLTLRDNSWLRTAAGLSQRFYTDSPASLPLYAVAQPTLPVNGLWIQDVKVKDNPGMLTAGDLVRQIEAAFSVKVVDMRSIGGGDLAGNANATAREQELGAAVQHQQATSWTAKLAGWATGLTGTLKTVRALFVLALVVAIVIYTWPWLTWLRRRFAPRGARA